MENETLVFFGDGIKALGDGKVAGYLVRYGSPKDPDVEGDFFSAETDLGVIDGSSLPVYYNHGYDSVLKNKRIGIGAIKFDEVGAWFEAQLEMRDEYEKLIYEMVSDGKLGWSSGAAGHLVERKQVGKAWHIKSWPIGEASVTPTPAEPRNAAQPVKSLLPNPEPEAVAIQDEGDTEIQTFESTMEDNKEMDENTKAAFAEVVEEMKADLIAHNDESIKAAVTEISDAAEKARKVDKPDVTAGFADGVEVVEDEADKSVKFDPMKAGEFYQAIHKAAVEPHAIDQRLQAHQASAYKTLKQLGLNESVPSDGGFLVTSDIAPGLYQNVWNTGQLLSLYTPTEVSGNGLTINAVDESSRATGSRMGGVRGYWLSEGLDKTKSKPTFRQIELKLKKVAALLYATDELLEDATALGSWINNNVPQELTFLIEDSTINGNGVGMPLGILNSGSLISSIRENASTITDTDVMTMWSRRYLGVRDYVWLANSDIYPQLGTMTIGDQPVWQPPGYLADQPHARLLGQPVIETEYNPGLGSVGDLLLMSPSMYAMIRKGGIQSASSIHVQFVTDEETFRFVSRVDGEPMWDTPVTKFKASSDTVSPFIALAATT